MEPTRIAKLMATRGLCSRREAEHLIARGWVYADGELITEPGKRVMPEADITLDNRASALLKSKITILFHKPVGVVSGQPEKGYPPAVSLITPENQYRQATARTLQPAHLHGLAPAGRLDIDSHGLLVLTQDGVVARQLVGSAKKIDKEYLVRFGGELTDDKLMLLNHGLVLDGKPLMPAQVSCENEHQLKFILWEGRKRQIRRMCAMVGLTVIRLKRTRIGNITLGDLPYGKWRFLDGNERF
ncbi:MAG TPA: rRNA pseudouridine synthase [Candidatus Hydrogenedentes bacterium]|nr:rRNA pseudouridine synthase [Candidatus Hydrogenedentota bacterium]